MLTATDILAALRDCFDPEVKLNVIDLGLVYAIALDADPESTQQCPRQRVKVTMTLTAPPCAKTCQVLERVENRLRSISAIGSAEVELVWEPRWTPHRISQAGRRRLGI